MSRTRNKRSNNKSRRRRPRAAIMNRVSHVKSVMNICAQPLKRHVNVQYSVYAVYNNNLGTTFYSFSSSTTQTLPSLTQNLYNDFITSPEFTNLAAQYNYYKLHGVMIKASSTILNNPNISDAPPVFLDCGTASSLSSVNSTSAARADNSLHVKINSHSLESPTIYYRMPPVLVGAGGNIIGGTSVFTSSLAANSSNLFYMLMGYLSGPTFIPLAVNTVVRVLTLDVYWDCTFAAQVQFS